MAALNEASLGRVYWYVQQADNQSLAILTAYRGENTKRDNESLHERLAHDLRSAGLGACKLWARWRECEDRSIPYGDCPPNKIVEVSEPVFAVVGITMELAHKLGNKYDQDAILFLGPKTQGKAILNFRDGSEDVIGTFRPERIAQAYSRTKGKTFFFVGFDYPPQTFAQAMIEQTMMRKAGAAPE